MKQPYTDAIRLSGTAGGKKYRLGVANPFTRRRPAPLGPRHLQALSVLLGFADASRLGERFEVAETEFVRRFPDKDALSLLKTLLLCWVCTSAGDATVYSYFAAVTFCEDAGCRTISVSFSEQIIPVLRRMLGSGLPKAALKR